MRGDVRGISTALWPSVSAVPERARCGTVVAGFSNQLESGHSLYPALCGIDRAGRTARKSKIARAIARLSAEAIDVQLWIHSPPQESAYLRDLASHAVRIEGPPDPKSIAALLAGTDLLVLPYNFDARSARYIRLSLPTKAPAYMISGTPILVYAPGDVAMRGMPHARAGICRGFSE